MCRAQLGSKARAWAQLEQAQALIYREPGPGSRLGLGSGSGCSLSMESENRAKDINIMIKMLKSQDIQLT